MAPFATLTLKSYFTALKVGFESVETWPFVSISILFWQDLLWLNEYKVNSIQEENGIKGEERESKQILG